jgi:PAS domain S-box-containing protein
MKKVTRVTRLNNWLNNISIQDPVERHMASLLQIVLIGLMIVVILATLALVAVPEQSAQEKINVILNDAVGFLVIMFPLGLLRRGYFRASVLIIISILFITPTLAVAVLFDLPSSGGILFQFTLAIILAGLLVSRSALVIIYTLSATVVYASAFRGQNVASNLALAVNFILFNGLIALFIDRFGITLRTALTNALNREEELQNEIAGRKRAVEQIRYQASILASIDDAIIATDENNRITGWNPAAESMYGWKAEEVIGQAGMDILKTEFNGNTREEVLNVLAETGKWRGEVTQARKGGSRFPVEAASIVLRNELGQITSYVSVNRDITERKQTEDALRVSDQAYANLLKNLTGAVYRCRNDNDWTVEYISGGCTALTGYQPQDIIESRVTSLGALMHPEDVAPVWEKCQINLAAKKTCSNEYRIYRRNGEMRWVWDQAQGVYSDEGELVHIEGLLTDITERKQAEEKLEWQNLRFKALREIDTAILAADSVEHIARAALDHIRDLINCQRAVVGLFDFEMNEWVVFNISGIGDKVVPRQTRIPLTLYEENLMKTLSKDQLLLIDDLMELEDPPVQIQRLIEEGLRSQCILPLFSQGTLIGLLGLSSTSVGFFSEDRISFAREVANQVAIAITQNDLLDALQRSNMELKKHAAENEELIEELTAKNAELERFTYTVSHDLKSPLVTMKGFLGYLEQDMRSGNMDRLKEDSTRIANAVDKMSLLLNDLLELSRIGRFIANPMMLSFDELVQAAMALVEGRLIENEVTVQVQPDLPIVYGDQQRLIEVLQNLLDNAAKYIGGQSKPLIEIGHLDSDDEEDESVFYVKDNGMGIALEYHETIFGLFNKLDVGSEGTGVGLALVKRIIEFHGGRIWVESEVEKGSTFFFTLPSKPKPDSVI